MNRPPDRDAYFEIVWEIARQIPEGQVSTYGQIAAMIPPPEGITPPDYDRVAPRWVGQAMNATPPGHDIPWQRVINSQGKISLPTGSSAAIEQERRLKAEGVQLDDKGRVNFEEVGWNGPPDEWLEARGLFRPPPLRRDGGQMRLF